MLYAPALYSLRTNSLFRTNDAINGMTSEQLRTGILQRCVSGRLTASYVALFDFTMQQPFRHFCSLSWGTHDTQHSAPARWLHPLPPGQQPLIPCVVAVIRSPCVVGRRTFPTIQAVMRQQARSAAKGNGPAQRHFIDRVQAIEQEELQAAAKAAETGANSDVSDRD